jgi:hypothetical protein
MQVLLSFLLAAFLTFWRRVRRPWRVDLRNICIGCLAPIFLHFIATIFFNFGLVALFLFRVLVIFFLFVPILLILTLSLPRTVPIIISNRL